MDLSGSTLMVSGGTGSFGSTIVRHFLTLPVAEIRIVSRDEKKQEDQRQSFADGRIKHYVADVRDFRAMESVTRGVDFIYHAAALKQVPSCEFHPMEAVNTNVVGTHNVLDAAIRNGVQRVVCLSTDKAVYPINAMGMSKALMEKLMVAKSRVAAQSGTVLCATRYGNVMASRGSVIPLFIEQIRSGRPLTVTDPHMTRFMMTIEDAVELVVYAFTHGQPGDLFVQKAPAATIEVLAEAMKKVFDVDNPIRLLGTRHGEKLYETLLTREEMARADDLGGYYRVPADGRDLNYDSYFTEGETRVSETKDYHSHNTERLDVDGMAALLRRLDVVQQALGMLL